jgi:glutathione synthase/RimK-type ligase-like ATP-grasp enzyme
MRIGLATCRVLPGWEVDDRFLHQGLETRAVDFDKPIWDDPGVRWRDYDAVLIRTTWDYQEKLPAFLAWVDEVSTQTRLFNPPEIVRWNTHKSYLRDLEDKGIPIIETEWLEAGTRPDLRALLTDRGWDHAFLKPMVGAVARETLRFRADDLREAQAHIDRLLPHEGLMLQPYLSRVETHGEVSTIHIGGELAQVVQKVPVPGDYRVQDDWGATDHATTLEPEELALSERVLAAAPVSDLLYARVDYLRNDNGQLNVTELELIEPSLFFRHCPESGLRLTDALIQRL